MMMSLAVMMVFLGACRDDDDDDDDDDGDDDDDDDDDNDDRYTSLSAHFTPLLPSF